MMWKLVGVLDDIVYNYIYHDMSDTDVIVPKWFTNDGARTYDG